MYPNSVGRGSLVIVSSDKLSLTTVCKFQVNEGTDQDSLLKKYRQEIATLRAQLAQAHAQAAEGVSPAKQAFSRAAAAAAASARRISSSGDDIDVDSEEQVSLLMSTATAIACKAAISEYYDAQGLLLLLIAASLCAATVTISRSAQALTAHCNKRITMSSLAVIMD
jgi:hypothetical protein